MEISGYTRLGCLIGSPVAHSLSPAMYNETFRLLDIDNVYLCFDTKGKDLATILQSLRDMNVFGFNVTMPNKELILPLLDDVDPAARMIGAVNTVKNDNGRFIGYNTDSIGYVDSMKQQGYDFNDCEMTLMGAGGAASAIAIQVALAGTGTLHIANRKTGKSYPNALRLAAQINAETSCKADVIDLSDMEAMRAALANSTLLTNATSAGMGPRVNELPISDLSILHEGLFVSDIIYNPRKTRLMEEAEKQGLQTCNGFPMVLAQGAAAFRIWTGKEMPVDAIRKKVFS